MQESAEEKRARWALYFDVEQFITRPDSDLGHNFGRFMSSDGASLSVKMLRKKVETSHIHCCV